MPVKAYRKGYLHQAVRSMLGQTSPDWRLLVIAEKADCKTLERVLAGHLLDPRIEVIANEGRKLAGAFKWSWTTARGTEP
jgi:hypothetical protein